jgi:hypothetical protein
MNIFNISPMEAAEIHFRNSSHNSHYPDDKYIKEFQKAGLSEDFIKNYEDAWWNLWAIDYDSKLEKK